VDADPFLDDPGARGFARQAVARNRAEMTPRSVERGTT
jgi:hypothetical protein